MPRGDREGLVDVVDRESHPMHADLVRPGGLRLDRVGVDVLEELEATVAVWRLGIAMLAWLPSRPTAVSVHSPLTVSRPRTVSPRSVKSDRRFQVADGDADVLQLDAHALHATRSRRRVQVGELPVPAQPDKELSRSCARRTRYRTQS